MSVEEQNILVAYNFNSDIIVFKLRGKTEKKVEQKVF